MPSPNMREAVTEILLLSESYGMKIGPSALIFAAAFRTAALTEGEAVAAFREARAKIMPDARTKGMVVQ